MKELNRIEVAIIKEIASSPRPLGIGEISKRTRISWGTINNYIPILEKKGFIQLKKYETSTRRYYHITSEIEEQIIKNKEEEKKICPRDYNKNHRWERIGYENHRIIYQCIQCKKCAFEPIEIIGNIKEL